MLDRTPALVESTFEYLCEHGRPAVDAVEVAYQYLCEHEMQALNDSINAGFAASAKFLGKPVPWGWRPPAKPRGRPPQQRDRNMQIAGAVAMLVKLAGLRPTRNHSRAQHAPSACSIVKAALEGLSLNLDERTVEGIWDRYHRSPSLVHPKAWAYIRKRYRLICP
jgi:hypothetical protein